MENGRSAKDLEKRLTEDKIRQEIDVLEKEVFDYRKKITDFSNILNSHQYTSKIFNYQM